MQHAAAAASLTERGEPAQTAASVAADPARLETDLLEALRSPAVEEALVELFSRTLSKALLRASANETTQAVGRPPRPSTQRVLLAGFPETLQKALMEALGGSFRAAADHRVEVHPAERRSQGRSALFSEIYGVMYQHVLWLSVKVGIDQ